MMGISLLDTYSNLGKADENDILSITDKFLKDLNILSTPYIQTLEIGEEDGAKQMKHNFDRFWNNFNDKLKLNEKVDAVSLKQKWDRLQQNLDSFSPENKDYKQLLNFDVSSEVKMAVNDFLKTKSLPSIRSVKFFNPNNDFKTISPKKFTRKRYFAVMSHSDISNDSVLDFIEQESLIKNIFVDKTCSLMTSDFKQDSTGLPLFEYKLNMLPMWSSLNQPSLITNTKCLVNLVMDYPNCYPMKFEKHDGIYTLEVFNDKNFAIRKQRRLYSSLPHLLEHLDNLAKLTNVPPPELIELKDFLASDRDSNDLEKWENHSMFFDKYFQEFCQSDKNEFLLGRLEEFNRLLHLIYQRKKLEVTQFLLEPCIQYELHSCLTKIKCYQCSSFIFKEESTPINVYFTTLIDGFTKVVSASRKRKLLSINTTQFSKLNINSYKPVLCAENSRYSCKKDMVLECKLAGIEKIKEKILSNSCENIPYSKLHNKGFQVNISKMLKNIILEFKNFQEDDAILIITKMNGNLFHYSFD